MDGSKRIRSSKPSVSTGTQTQRSSVLVPKQEVAIPFFQPTIMLPRAVIQPIDSTSRQDQAGMYRAQRCMQSPPALDLSRAATSREIELIDLTDSPCKPATKEAFKIWKPKGLAKSHTNTGRTAVLPPPHPGPSCPICLEKLLMISSPPTSTTIVSTKCGHLFCKPCLVESLHHQKVCPQCRTKITLKQFHPIFL